ncbi:hypothetical protein [Treponema pectinovorum]|uniref:hypothetical protein n=1 Tax=Treponema pectinovorum TaxID=164 RepID=UPI0011C724DD|nr:hypothetical protein [Treponema pectinovorum]
MLKIEVWRNRKSYDFKANPAKSDSFDNNWKNNNLDLLLLLDEKNKVLFKGNAQTVANYCFGKQKAGDKLPYGDTVARGKFTVRCFVEPRGFHGEIHAITTTTDLDGQLIDREAMQITDDGFQNGRWLIHDRFSKKLGKDTNYAWSSGCFILSSNDLLKLNETLKNNGINAGDEIQGEVLEDF